jgi:hypothetical protein
MDLPIYRREVLNALQAARKRQPPSNLFLLYSPGDDDPLDLATSTAPPRRRTAAIAWGQDIGYRSEHYPRVIELDCRKVASYLLESDPALDDPLLEETITRTHEQLHTEYVDLDDGGLEPRPICGWLASRESPEEIARRFMRASEPEHPRTMQRRWLRWHDPHVIGLLWPTLSIDQRHALLGPEMIWLTQDAAGHLVQFSAQDGMHNDLSRQVPLSVSASQWDRMGRVGLIHQLIQAWRAHAKQPLPRGAAELLHQHVERAQVRQLNGRDLQAYVFTAMDLRDGFDRDPRMETVVREAISAPGTLADLIGELPPDFRKKYERAP